MNVSNNTTMIIRPFSSKKGLIILFICLLIGLFFTAIVGFLFIFTPDGDPTAQTLMTIMGTMSAITIILGIILYLVFPRAKIIFDSSRKTVTVKTNSNADSIFAFENLQSFQIYEIIRGYAHQYYCKNASFGNFSDLFFSSSHKKTLQRARKLSALTGAALIDYDGKIIEQK